MIMINCAFAQNHLESTGNKVTLFYVGSGLDLSYNIVNLDDKGYGRDIYSYKQLGYGVDTYFGYDISKKYKYPLAIELEYTYRDEKTNEQTHYESTFFPSVGRKFHVFSQFLMANILYEYKNIELKGWLPYAGVGIGVSRLETWQNNDEYLNGSGFHSTQDSFSWSILAGVTYQLNNKWSLDTRLRYIDLGTPEFLEAHFSNDEIDYYSDRFTSHISAVEALISLRYIF